jgi:5'(3')-deoxyribonucleotidase
VLADFVAEAAIFAKREGYARTHEDCTQWDIWKAWELEHLEEHFASWLQKWHGARNLSVLPGAKSFVAELRKRGEVVFVTSPYTAVRGWCDDRLAWLGQHFDAKPADVVFCKRKELVRGDVLIDDSLANVNAFGQHALLFNQPWNRSAEPEAGFAHYAKFRVRSYRHALASIDAEFT